MMRSTQKHRERKVDGFNILNETGISIHTHREREREYIIELIVLSNAVCSNISIKPI